MDIPTVGPSMAAIPIPTSRQNLCAFRITAELDANDLEFIERVCAHAFDSFGTIDVLLQFDGIVSMPLVDLPARLKARRFAVIGLDEGLIETTLHIAEPGICTFAAARIKDAWRYVEAEPLVPPHDVTAEEWDTMSLVVVRACLAVDEGGKVGIAAAVVKHGVVVALDANEVHLASDPTRHAEIVAISRAGHVLQTADLSGCTLFSSLQPCEMCLAAMRFAGIDRVVFAAQQHQVPDKYFKFNALTLQDFMSASPTAFSARGGVLDHIVLPLYCNGDE